MTPTRSRLFLVIGLAALCFGACDTSGTSEQQVESDESQEPGPQPEPSSPTLDDDPGCDAYVVADGAMLVDWLESQVATGECSDTIPAIDLGLPGPLSMYASCESKSHSPAQCTLSNGMQFCGADAWTALCQKNSDCPSGAVCLWPNGVGDVPPEYDPPYGSCQRACATPGSGDCGRCDYSCYMELGVCTPIVTQGWE